MESNFESWEWRERVYDGAVVWPFVTALKVNTQLLCNTVPTRIFGAESDSWIKCVLCKLSYTIHDILFTPYFCYYSSVHNSPTLCDVHPQYCLSSNYFSHTLWLLGAASHCCSTLSWISLSWISMFPHCLSASIHKLLANWQMAGCEWPSVTSFAQAVASPAQCIVSLPLSALATPLLSWNQFHHRVQEICRTLSHWCNDISQGFVVLTDTHGTGTAGPPVQCKGTAEDMLSSAKWTVADLLFISVQQPQISAPY